MASTSARATLASRASFRRHLVFVRAISTTPRPQVGSSITLVSSIPSNNAIASKKPVDLERVERKSWGWNLGSTRFMASFTKDDMLRKFQSARNTEIRERIWEDLLEHELGQAEFMLLMLTTQSKEEYALTIKIYEKARARVKPTGAMLNSAIDAYGAERDFEKALDVFDEYEDLAPRDLNAYNACILALSLSPHEHHFDRAVELFGDIDEANLTADEVSYHGVLQSCKTHGKWRLGLELLDLMDREDDLKSDKVAHVLALGACSVGAKEKGKAEAAKLVFQSMEQKGLVRDESAYEPLILALEIGGAHAEAIDLFNDMQKRDLQWTTKIYNSIIRTLAQMRLYDAGQELFDKMTTTGLSPDAETYAALFLNCKRGGEFERALEALEEATESGIQPTKEMYEGLIESAARNAKKDEAVEYFVRIQDELKESPSLRAYTSCIEACGYHKDWYTAADLFRDLISGDSAVPDTKLYNTVIYAVGMGGQLELAESFVADMKARKVEPDVDTFNNLICAAGNAKNPSKAIELFDEIIDSGMQRNENTYSRMMDALEGTQFSDDMFAAFKSLMTSGISGEKFTEIVAKQKSVEENSSSSIASS